MRQLAQQVSQGVLFREVLAVTRRILRYQYDFLNAFFCELFGFKHQ